MGFENGPLKRSIPKEKKEITRRTFLKGAALAAISLWAGKGIKKFFDNHNQLENFERGENEKDLKIKLQRPEFEENGKEVTISKERARETLKIFQQKYEELSRKGEQFWPSKVFTSDFFITIQLIESEYNPKAESSAGAFGIMQNMPVSVEDIVRYLTILNRQKVIVYQGPDQKEIKENIESIKQVVKENANWGRVLGKLYCIVLFACYEIGQEEYRRKDYEAAQKKIFPAYNFGHSIWNKKWKDWPAETKNYYFQAIAYLKRLKNIRAKIKARGIVSRHDYVVMLIARQQGRPREESHEKLEDSFVEKQIEKVKQAEKKKGAPLTDREIRALFI